MSNHSNQHQPSGFLHERIVTSMIFLPLYPATEYVCMGNDTDLTHVFWFPTFKTAKPIKIVWFVMNVK